MRGRLHVAIGMCLILDLEAHELMSKDPEATRASAQGTRQLSCNVSLRYDRCVLGPMDKGALHGYKYLGCGCWSQAGGSQLPMTRTSLKAAWIGD